MLGSDNVKEQKTLSATELGELSLVHAALTVQMKKSQIQIVVAYICFNKTLSQRIV